MNQKIKVNKKLFEALESAKEIHDGDFNKILIYAVRSIWDGERKPLNGIYPFELSKMLMFGYELELNEKEKILEMYNFYKEKYAVENDKVVRESHYQNMKRIKRALRDLGMEIEGINK